MGCQIQGSLLSVPLHPRDHGQGEGREAEAVFAAWSSGQGAQVTRAARKRTPSEEPRLFCCVLYYALEHKIKWRDAMRSKKKKKKGGGPKRKKKKKKKKKKS